MWLYFIHKKVSYLPFSITFYAEIRGEIRENVIGRENL